MPQERQNEILAALSELMQRDPPETERLRLRRFREEDFHDFAAYILQKEQQRLSGNSDIDTEEEARELFDRLLDPDRPPRAFAMVLKSETRVVGNFSIGASPFLERDPALREKRGVTFSVILNEDCWRRGLVTELLRAALDWVFEKTELDFVNTGYFPFNVGSRRVQEKAGMRFYAQSVFERDGRRIPTVEMLMTREDWRAMRGK